MTYALSKVGILRKAEAEDHRFEVSMGCRVRPSLKTTEKLAKSVYDGSEAKCPLWRSLKEQPGPVVGPSHFPSTWHWETYPEEIKSLE